MKRLGSIYILTIIIVISSSILISGLFNLSMDIRKKAETLSKYTNDYYIALGGLEKGLNILNFNLFNNKELLLTRTDSYLSSIDLNNYIYYNLDDLNNVYDGEFRLKEKDGNTFKGSKDTLFKKILFVYFSSYIINNLEMVVYELEYIDKNYLVTVSISLNNNFYEITSKADNITNNDKLELFAKAELKQNVENVWIGYNFKNQLQRFENNVYTNKKIINNNSTINGNILENGKENIILENNNNFFNEPYVYIANSGIIDLSLFDYKKSYIIINFNNTQLNFVSSSNFEFNGLICSVGEINFNDVIGEINGNVICKEDITFNNSFINFTNNKNIFDVLFSEEKNQREIFDILKLTNFKQISNFQIDDRSSLNTVFGNLKLDSLIGYNIEDLKFELKNIIQIE